MRILVICPGTATRRSGAGQRLRMTIRALQRLGSVEVLALTNDPVGDELTEDVGVTVTRVALVSRSRRPHDYLVAAIGMYPRRMSAARLRAQRRHVSLTICPSDFDLIWALTDRAFLSLPRRLLTTPVVADLVDYEVPRDIALVRAREQRPNGLRVALAVLDGRALTRTLRRVTRRADATVISSAIDRDRLGVPEVRVVSNSYHLDSPRLDRASRAARPTFLFAGAFGYPPNFDAAHWLVSAIWPLLLEGMPGAELRLVGRGIPEGQFDNVAGVTVVGEVSSMEAELSRASAVLVPLRSGSGTRVKILEAWAHHIPVVSTTVGSEGLGAQHGEHLLIADAAYEFALAAERIVSDQMLAEHLCSRGGDLFDANYTATTVEKQIVEIATRLLETRRQPPSSSGARPRGGRAHGS